ncbi:hypothetical protein [Nocardia africana]
MTDRDIIDAIDELVDAQMRQTRSGYDFNINQDQCPHAWCSEPWHGLAITKRMREMRRKWQAAVNYYEDEDGVTDDIAAELDAYRYDQDDSEILCPGSSFTGEFEPPEPEYPRHRVARSTWTVTAGHAPSLPVEVQFPRPWIVNPTVTLFREGESGWQELGTIASDGIQITPNESSVEAWGSGETIRTDSVRSFTIEFTVRQPRWWRCDDVSDRDISLTRTYPDRWNLGETRITERSTAHLNVDGRSFELLPDSDGIDCRWGSSTDGTHWVEARCIECPGAVWYPRDEQIPGYDDGRTLTASPSTEEAA